MKDSSKWVILSLILGGIGTSYVIYDGLFLSTPIQGFHILCTEGGRVVGTTIPGGTITGCQIKDGTVDTWDLADNAVNGSKITASAFRSHISTYMVEYTETIPEDELVELVAWCGDDDKIMGGGVASMDEDVLVYRNHPAAFSEDVEAWIVDVYYKGSGFGHDEINVTVYGICMSLD